MLMQTSIQKSLEKNRISYKKIIHDSTSHLLINSDCSNVNKILPTKSVDLIITDPPYNQDINYGNEFKDNKSWDEYYIWLKEKLKNLPDILSNKGSLYLMSYPEIGARMLPFLEDELKLKFRRWITWHYPTNIGHSKKNYTRSQRSILFFTKSSDYVFNREKLLQHYKNPTAPVIRKRLEMGITGRASYDLLRFMDLIELQKGLIDVLDFNLLKNNSKDRVRNLNSKFHRISKEELKQIDHPCQLPLGLLEIFIKVSSNPKDIVYDPFAGSFTTSVAAGKNGRNSIGVEINKDFIDFGEERFNTNREQIKF